MSGRWSHLIRDQWTFRVSQWPIMIESMHRYSTARTHTHAGVAQTRAHTSDLLCPCISNMLRICTRVLTHVPKWLMTVITIRLHAFTYLLSLNIKLISINFAVLIVMTFWYIPWKGLERHTHFSDRYTMN